MTSLRAKADEMSFGVYVHVPFCAARCDYCAFATWTDRAHLMADYAAACVTELRAATLPPATSVFFGGGTPSLLPAELLLSVLDVVSRAEGAEVTVECNPDTVSAALFAAYRAAGVNRVSFGVQSMVPHVLRGLGRSHSIDHVRTAVALAADAGFDSYNVDLIYGGAGESMADWEATLAAVLALDPAPLHVSAYALTVEPGTPLAADPARHPDDDDQADKYLRADAMLAAAGLRNYEISNWARPGYECRHNLLYWSQGDYRGIGCAAHSHEAGRRWWNVRTPERYIAAIADGRSPVAADETLDAPTRALERLQLALRTSAGVPRTALATADDLTSADLLFAVDPDTVALTPRGRLLANEVAARLRT
ncbi:MAG: radical SAM family heme chaperone HemW [Actinobacteria bacterium]|nr:radical SAM family heme chaperone HemW [Actinomycetota bacterium]